MSTEKVPLGYMGLVFVYLILIRLCRVVVGLSAAIYTWPGLIRSVLLGLLVLQSRRRGVSLLIESALHRVHDSSNIRYPGRPGLSVGCDLVTSDLLTHKPGRRAGLTPGWRVTYCRRLYDLLTHRSPSPVSPRRP